jgi:Spy/CpxP family protein refolding chaperone
MASERTGMRDRAAWAVAALAALLAGLAAVAVATSGRAGEPPGRNAWKGPPGSIVHRHAGRLGLRGAALAEIEQIVRESGERDAALQQQIDAARERMRTMLDADADAVAVLAQAEALGALESEARKNRLTAVMQIRTHLDARQRAEVQHIHDEELAAEHGRGSAAAACARELAACPQSSSARQRLACLEARWSELGAGCRGALEGLF